VEVARGQLAPPVVEAVRRGGCCGLSAPRSSRSGQYLYGGPGIAPQYHGGRIVQTVWGLALTTSPVVTQQNPVVGDSNGVTLFVREPVSVRTSDSDSDDFTKNRLTILAETRVALAVWRPSWFTKAATS
jgi:hypothetical protein